ncbi:hypothetical protein F5Y18DRAFT_423056 [Xylariaceae sp. FL1019]|nr:hypothetical protein F5Y18DRAFT_423056 [Xylariaceae sp. FL1019]
MDTLKQSFVVLNGSPVLRLTEDNKPQRELGDAVCRSKFHPHIYRKSKTINLAKHWPAIQVNCDPCRERWTDKTSILSPLRPDADMWSALKKSGMSPTEVREAAGNLEEMIKDVMDQKTEETNAVYQKHLQRVKAKKQRPDDRTSRQKAPERGRKREKDSESKLHEKIMMISTVCYVEYLQAFCRTHTHTFPYSSPEFHDARSILTGMCPFHRKAREILPYDDEIIFGNLPKLEVKLSLKGTPIYKDLRHIAIHTPLCLVENFLPQDDDDLYNALALTVYVNWSQMPNLETVFLDLRTYSLEQNTDFRLLSKKEIAECAREMGRHLQLKSLLLAGLGSQAFQMGYHGMEDDEVEEEEEIDGQPNWIKLFYPALRPGGKIIFVDLIAP